MKHTPIHYTPERRVAPYIAEAIGEFVALVGAIALILAVAFFASWVPA